MINSSQLHVTGDVKIKLFKGNIAIVGVRSQYSLMDAEIATYGEENKLWNGRDAEGFAKIYGLQSLIWQSKTRSDLVMERNDHEN